MADNYLEHRMEDYRSGKLAATRSLHPKAGSPAKDDLIPLSGARVLILAPSASASPRVRALITLLRSAGCRVAFTDTESRDGLALACKTGSQCHPVDCSDEVAVERSRDIITRRWGGIDFTVDIREDSPE